MTQKNEFDMFRRTQFP